MTESEMLERMVPPGRHRPGKYGEQWGFGGVVQILVTSNCDKSCFNCTQASNVRRPPRFMTPEQFEQAVRSLGHASSGIPDAIMKHDPSTYPGVVGVFGGNPAVSPHFAAYCEVLRRLVPFERRGLWCNNPVTDENAREMARTFNPAVSNLNVHMDRYADELFRAHWPAAKPFGLGADSRHSPVFVAMKDVVRRMCPGCDGSGRVVWHIGLAGSEPCSSCAGIGAVPDDDRIRELVSTCDINQHWSAMIGVFRGELRAWFCEVAGAQAILHQDEPDYPDTGLDPRLEYAVEPMSGQLVSAHAAERITGLVPWWRLPMIAFRDQVRKHCWDCGVPLRGYGELAQADLVTGPRPSRCTCGADRTGPSAEAHAPGCPENPREQISATHAGAFRPKRANRRVEVVTDLVQLETGKIKTATHYLQNASR